jgi:hypothetical protein
MKGKFIQIVLLLWGVLNIFHPCFGQNKETSFTKYLLLDNRVTKQVENAKLTVGVVKNTLLIRCL